MRKQQGELPNDQQKIANGINEDLTCFWKQDVNEIIAVDLLEKFTSKIVITPDYEEGGVITPDFTTPVKGLK